MSSGSSGPAHSWAACSQRSRTRLWFAETAGARSGRDSMPTLTLVAERTPSKAFHMDLKEVERLRKTLALKRRAHLKWEARGKQDTFYLERLERSAVLVGQSPLCDLRVPAGPKHYVLVLRNRTGYEVRNLSSWHRMRVNGAVVTQAPLKGGDVIETRGLRLTFFDEIA